VDPRTIIRQALQEQKGVRTAGANPFADDPDTSFKMGAEDPPGAPKKRDIPKDHPFDPKSLKPLVQTLWSLSVSLGHVLTAHRQFSRLKSVSFSPDGNVGGRGYVMPIKDIRKMLHEASEGISTICDTLYDEINAPHWKPKLGELEKNDDDFLKLLEDAKGYMDDPEGEAEEDMEEVEKRPMPKELFDTEDELGSKMPDGGDGGSESQGPNPARQDRPALKQKEASLDLSRAYSYERRADSSVNPDELGGPRIQHIGPGEQVQEDTQAKPREYGYPSGWENDLSGRSATPAAPVGESALPADTETKTEGYDFGIGYGNGNDAHGQGAENVGGPSAELPGTPALRGDPHNEAIEQATSGMGIPGGKAAGSFRESFQGWLKKMHQVSQGKLPNDGEDPVSRSDYYAGPKGNDFDGTPRLSEAELPGDGMGGNTPMDRDTPNRGYTTQPDSGPYVRWDSTTKNMRPDNTYQRGPVEGPYVKQ